MSGSDTGRRWLNVCFARTGNICRSPIAEIVFAEALRRLVAEPERVVLLRSFDPAAGEDLDVPDPYLGGRHRFDTVPGMVHAAVPGLLTWARGQL